MTFVGREGRQQTTRLMPNGDGGHEEACDGGPVRRVQYAERHDLEAKTGSGMAALVGRLVEERGLLGVLVAVEVFAGLRAMIAAMGARTKQKRCCTAEAAGYTSAFPGEGEPAVIGEWGGRGATVCVLP